jgi:hypothetical protein
VTLASSSFDNLYEGNNDWRFYSDERRMSWTLPGLYSWLWMGKGSNLVTLVGGRVTAAVDATGNGNNWDYEDDRGPDASTTGFTFGSHTTTTPALHGNNSAAEAGGGIGLVTPMAAEGEFYLGAFLANSRDTGNRYMWGFDITLDYIRLAQSSNRVDAVIDGSSVTTIAGDESVLPKTRLLYLEVWRDSNDIMHVAVDLNEVGSAVSMPGTFSWNGFGGKDTGSQWDDFLCEVWGGLTIPTLRERTEMYNMLRAKWHMPE